MTDQSGSGGDPGRARDEELSALLDGELQGSPIERICSAWRTDARSRDTWHTYSLIGDVMRCEDLARSCASDEKFLHDFRQRMAAEPIVLAPRPVQPAAVALAGTKVAVSAEERPARAWAWPMAWAAVFVAAVAVVVGVQNPALNAVAESQVALAPAVPLHSPRALTTVGHVEGAVPAPDAEGAGMELVFDGQVIRDPRLDRYLLAHKQFAGNSVLGSTSGLLRNAALEVPAR